MPNVEFFRKSNNQPLPFDAEEGRFVWRQYTLDDWYVRVSDPNITAVFIRVENKDFELEKYISADCFTLSNDPSNDVGNNIKWWIKAKTGHEPNFGGWVALLELWSSNGKGQSQQLDPPLYIEPGNLAPKDFDAIIERLQELAFFRYSPTKIKREDRGGSTEDGTEDNEDELLKQAADKFLALIKQVRLNWPLVQATDSRETQLLPKLVDVSSAAGSYSSRLAAKIAQHPHARRVEILMPQESFATVENRFLVHALQEVYHRSPVFKGRLIARSNELRAEWKASDDKETKSKQKVPQWQEKQAAELQVADCLASLAQDITTAVEAIAPYINDPFLHEVRDHPALPVRPTDRLTRSFAYGPIYSAFCDYQNQPGISFEPLKPGMMQALNTKAIHPACTLYELWVFVELYNMLIHTFGFRLPAGVTTGHPLDYVDSAAGEIVRKALKDREFRLEFRPVNNPQRLITVGLWYDTKRPTPDCVPHPDPKQQKRCYDADVCHGLPCYRERHITRNWREVKPDVYLTIKDNSQEGGPMKFAVDAKYRNYKGFGVPQKDREKYDIKTPYELDLLMTAKMKYRDTLNIDAAFVVHSDADENEHTFWGDKPYKIVPHRERVQSEDWGPGHHYGAVFSNPSHTHNLRKLLKCFLMYHVGIENICWSCRSETKPVTTYMKKTGEKGYFDVDGRTFYGDVTRQAILRGRNYQCENQKCSHSWKRTWCEHVDEHPLFKLGNDNFHNQNQGYAVCPICGDGPRDDQNDKP